MLRIIISLTMPLPVASQGGAVFAEIVGLQANGNRAFDYKFPTGPCDRIFNAFPIHLEQLGFETANNLAVAEGTKGVASYEKRELEAAARRASFANELAHFASSKVRLRPSLESQPRALRDWQSFKALLRRVGRADACRLRLRLLILPNLTLSTNGANLRRKTRIGDARSFQGSDWCCL